MMNFRASSLRALVLCLVTGVVAGQEGGEETLLWSSTGGGWRAMFADVGYANVFQQAGIMTADSTRFSQVSTVSGGSWFSTQLFYSQAFYNQTVMAETPEQVEQFVLDWMATYASISTTFTNETKSHCNTSDWDNQEQAQTFSDICQLLYSFDFDWAIFIDQMLGNASVGYGDPTFINTIASPDNRIPVMSTSDLLIQAALVPTSRIRGSNTSTTTTAVYLGNDDANDPKLFTVPLSAAFVIEDTGTEFVYGTMDRTPELQTYTGQVPVEHSWSTWAPFFLYAGEGVYNDGTIEISNTAETLGQSEQASKRGTFRTPYGGPSETTVHQVAAISSAAAGNGSPLVPTVYTQALSIGRYSIEEWKTATVWRILAGIAAGLGAGLIIGYLSKYLGLRFELCYNEKSAGTASMVIGVIVGICIGLITAIFYGLGSVLVPTAYDGATNYVYKNSTFDNFAVCSQWPNPCGELDGFMIDGWFIDNPAVVINVGQYQQKSTTGSDKKLKMIVTNTNEVWDSTWNRAQILQYFSTYFNQGIPPGDFLWAPGYWAPFRSPQIFSDYLDEAGLDALLEPIADSNMTTAILKGTTTDNPSFGTKAGLPVEMLLLNLNENITTFVVGIDKINELTQPLADMTVHIASSQELVRRVRDFVAS